MNKDYFSINNLSHSCSYEKKEITFLEWEDIGIELEKLNYFTDALFAFNKGLKEKPSYIPLLLDKSRILQKLNKIDDSIDIYNYILKIDPNNNDSLLNLGNLYFVKKDYLNSINCY